VLTSVQGTSFVTTFSYYLWIIFFIMNTASMTMFGKRFDNGYYNLLMMKGGSRGSYALTLYATDVMCHVILCFMLEIFLYPGGLRMNGFWVGLVLFSLTDPLFKLAIMYYFQYSRRRSQTASTVCFAVSYVIGYVFVIMLTSMNWI